MKKASLFFTAIISLTILGTAVATGEKPTAQPCIVNPDNPTVSPSMEMMSSFEVTNKCPDYATKPKPKPSEEEE